MLAKVTKIRMAGPARLCPGLSPVRDRLVCSEDETRKAKLGLWAGSFTSPWDWRRGERGTSAVELAPPAATSRLSTASGGCKIKGNISAKGERIYHLPGRRSYDRTVLNEAAGERWFCSESEATAGWRSPRE